MDDNLTGGDECTPDKRKWVSMFTNLEIEVPKLRETKAAFNKLAATFPILASGLKISIQYYCLCVHYTVRVRAYIISLFGNSEGDEHYSEEEEEEEKVQPEDNNDDDLENKELRAQLVKVFGENLFSLLSQKSNSSKKHTFADCPGCDSHKKPSAKDMFILSHEIKSETDIFEKESFNKSKNHRTREKSELKCMAAGEPVTKGKNSAIFFMHIIFDRFMCIFLYYCRISKPC